MSAQEGSSVNETSLRCTTYRPSVARASAQDPDQSDFITSYLAGQVSVSWCVVGFFFFFFYSPDTTLPFQFVIERGNNQLWSGYNLLGLHDM